MYIPKFNRMQDDGEAIAFMKQYGFATVITSRDGVPAATHLPITVTLRDGQVVLSAHFAKANDQWKYIEGNSILVVFSEPHAYISPSNYEGEQNVPTWNYMAVHCYGKGRLLTEPEQVLALLEATIVHYEQSYKQQWDELPEKYRAGMMNGIVGFEVHVTDIQGKKKLSQNRTEAERRKIIETLSGSSVASDMLLAGHMRMEAGTSPDKTP